MLTPADGELFWARRRVEMMRESQQQQAARKDANEEQGLLFACQELVARNCGTSTIFAYFDLSDLAAVMASHLSGRRRFPSY